jgi:uncharacterized membrane protein YkvA (DUF1232 family)
MSELLPPEKTPQIPHDKVYSEQGFWRKLARSGGKAGIFVLEKALTLFYCLKDPETPAWAKGVIVAALGYFIFPLDAIPDIIPLAGYTDDLGTLAVAFTTVLAHIKSSHSDSAREQLQRLFGPKVKQVSSQDELPPPA